MTALYMDGFAHYGINAPGGLLNGVGVQNMLSGPWAQIDYSSAGIQVIGVIQAPYGTPTGTYALWSRDYSAAPYTARRVLPSNQTKLYMSFRYAISSLWPGDDWAYICDWRDSGNNVLYTLKSNTTGGLEIWSGSHSSLIVATSGPVIVPQNFAFIETCYDTTNNTITVRVNDAQATNTPVLIATGISSTPVAQNGFIGRNTGASGFGNIYQYITDLFVRNGSGTINNGWLGDRRVATLFASADTTVSGWTPNYYKEFGAGILGLTNANAYISAAAATALDVGNADFTLESMVRFNTQAPTGGYSSIFSRWDAGNNRRSYRLMLGSQGFNNGCLQFDTSTDGTAATVATKIQYPFVPNLNQWYHIALCRSAGQLLLFVNGQQLGLPITDSDTYYGGGAEPLTIGSEVSSGSVVANSHLTGWLDETRFTNGVSRYTGSFAMPTTSFPRGAGSDPNWTQTALLMGYDTAIVDESSYARTIGNSSAFQYLPTDGPAVGKYSTVNKQVPDDNTFISASLVNASNVLTMTTQPANNDTVTVGTTNGSTAAVYTFKTTLTGAAFEVLIDTTAQNTLLNLYNAINAGAGAGTKYGTGTTSNFDVNAVQLPVGQIQVNANLAGSGGNSIASTATGAAAHWATSTLTGGSSIPTPINFKIQRPPNNTTIISAVQTTIRALKSDAGTANFQTALVGALGGTDLGTIHPLTVSPVYYGDIMETDPDTSGAITPTTLVNGYIQINRTS